MLTLRGRTPPGNPAEGRLTTITFKLRVRTAGWIRDQADRDNSTPSMVVRRLCEQAEQGARWPSDVQEWLVQQAAQCGYIGDPDQALIDVVRQLAETYPNGIRLDR